MTPGLALGLVAALTLLALLLGVWLEWRRYQARKRAPFQRLQRMYRSHS